MRVKNFDNYARLAPDLDYDGDGKSNRYEYIFAQNLVSEEEENPETLATMQVDDEEFVCLEISLRKDDPLIEYWVKISDDLTNWTKIPIEWNGSTWVSSDPGLIDILLLENNPDGTTRIQVVNKPALKPYQPRFVKMGATEMEEIG
jgi:hypothetical protein